MKAKTSVGLEVPVGESSEDEDEEENKRRLTVSERLARLEAKLVSAGNDSIAAQHGAEKLSQALDEVRDC